MTSRRDALALRGRPKTCPQPRAGCARRACNPAPKSCFQGPPRAALACNGTTTDTKVVVRNVPHKSLRRSRSLRLAFASGLNPRSSRIGCSSFVCPPRLSVGRGVLCSSWSSPNGGRRPHLRRTERSTFISRRRERRTVRSAFSLGDRERRTGRSAFSLGSHERRTGRSTFSLGDS